MRIEIPVWPWQPYHFVWSQFTRRQTVLYINAALHSATGIRWRPNLFIAFVYRYA